MINDKIKKISIKNKNINLGTDVVSINSVDIANATISLIKNGPVNAIVKCTDYDFNSDLCNAWIATDIPYSDNGTHISFIVDSFSGYGGAYITIIDLQSYPTVGGNWTVRFNTTGIANLSIQKPQELCFVTEQE